MTVIGPKTALVSIGVSCQTAHQLRTHRPLIAELLGEDMRVVRTPFEWMLVPLASAAKMIRAGEYFPYRIDELDWCQHPYWPRYDCFFWHEDIVFDHPSRFLSRFAKSSQSLENVANAARRIFIISNTQNALPGIDSESGGFDFRIDQAGLDRLQAALDERYGASELYAVGYAEVTSARGARVFLLDRDDTAWTGPEDQWAAILRTILLERGPGRSREADTYQTEPQPA